MRFLGDAATGGADIANARELDCDAILNYINRTEGYADGAALEALDRLRLLVTFAKPVVRRWRDGKSCPDEIADLDAALNREVTEPKAVTKEQT